MAKPAFYTNESVHIAVAEGLKRRGLKALTARDAGNFGLSDVEQLEYAKLKKLVIVTHDDEGRPITPYALCTFVPVRGGIWSFFKNIPFCMF